MELPPLYVWKGDQKVKYDALSDEDKSYIQNAVTQVWTNATNQHIQTLVKQPKRANA